MSRQRSAIEWQDIVAATFVVGKDSIECDYLDHQEAVDNLPAEGGGIYTLPGTYDRTTTINVGTKQITFTFAGGAVVDINAAAVPIFTVPDSVGIRRTVIVQGGKFLGGNVANQELLRYSDSSAQVEFYFQDMTARSLRCIVNFTEYDITYFHVSWVKFLNCFLPPPNVGTSEPFKSPNPAGTYTGALTVILDKCLMVDSSDYSLGWGNIDFDGDLFLYDCLETRIVAGGSWTVDGADVYGSLLENTAGAGWSLTALGPAFDSFMQWVGVTIYDGTITFPQSSLITNIMLNDEARLELDTKCVLVNALVRQTPGAVTIDVLSGAANVAITGCVFMDSATAAIRNAGQAVTITGCVFDSTGAHKTILEVSPADFNTYENNDGTDGSGGGLVIVGASTRVEGALYAISTGETTDDYVTIFTRINPNGLLGIGTIKNTDGANSLTVRETVTDAFGVTDSLETPVAAGADRTLSPQANIDTARPPYFSYAVAVKATVAGNQADYTARMVFQGAQL